MIKRANKNKMELIEQVINRHNMMRALQQVRQNKGSAGVDRMPVSELYDHLTKNRESIEQSLLNGTYLPQPILGVEIPKGNGKTRLLGVPTVVDRMLQQAVGQVLANRFEMEFEDYSYGFRPNKNALQAVLKALEYINNGYQDIVDIDLKSFFDEVDHCILLQLLYRKVKCPLTLRLIRKWLRAPILINGKLVKRRKGVPQGSPLSPILSNIMLDELDKELDRRGLKSVRYADDFSIYCKSQWHARKTGNEIFLFLKSKLHLPINREKSGIRRPVNFSLLGYGFVPTYKKGEKGKYQLVVSGKGWKNLKLKLKAITRKTTPASFDERIHKLKEVQRGWLQYYRMASIQEKLKDVDGWVRNRFRCCIWKQWKKSERRRKNLIRLGVDLERKQRIVVFETDSSISKKVEQDTVPDSDDDITVFIRREFGFHGLHNLMALRQGNIAVAMVPVSEQFGEDRLVSVLDNVIRRYELHCHKPVRVGIGNCYEYLEDMKESYKEAESALRIASIISSRQKINFYGKMGLYTVISQIPNGKFLDGYVESRIGPLLEADRLQNGSLCDTLKSFLDHGGNANAAAEALYIHRNTMRYRLDKIRKILNSDLGDLSVCLELKLAFAIQRYRRNMK